MSRWLVTGGAGFIGSHVVDALVERGAEVRVLDDLSTGREENLAGVRARIELVRGDCADEAAVTRAATGCERVVHLAALSSVEASLADPLATDRVNARGTLLVLEAARRAGARRVVVAASASAYGDAESVPNREAMRPAPRSPYAVSKLAGELYAQAYHASFGLETVALRYFNVFGPRQDPASAYAAVVPRFIEAYLDGTAPLVHGDGKQTRDFTYVSNAVDATLAAAEAPGVGGAVLNVACGVEVSLLELLDRLAEIFGRRIEPRLGPARAGDVRHSRADVTAAARLLGYRPRVPFEEGLRRTVAWSRARGAEGKEGRSPAVAREPAKARPDARHTRRARR
jgi:UDP-glucose 4-epimerase